MNWPAFRLGSAENQMFKNKCMEHINATIPDVPENRELREKLIPTYEPGCKRVLVTNKWLPSMLRTNVHLITDKVIKLSNDSVVTTQQTF